MRALFGCALAIVLSFGRVEAQSGTIDFGWVASLEVEAAGEMAAVREVLEAVGVPFVLHFTPSRSLMARDAGGRDSYVSPVTFRPTNTNLNALVAILDGRITYAATEVSLDGVEDGLIRMPEVGEARSEEEYRSIVTDQIRQLRETVRDMVRAYRNVECTVGKRVGLLQCNQSRGDSSQ